MILFFFISAGFSQEVCNNGVDDDADGLIDINDPDCTCNQQLITSLIPNSSFEDFTSCESDAIPLPGWVEANELSPDYYNQACNSDWSNVPQPYPDGNGVVGQIVTNYNSEYIGTCLTGPLTAGTTYQLTFKITTDIGLNSCQFGLDPIDITLYGAGSCGDMPIAFGAVPNSNTPFVTLGSANYTPIVAWGELTIVFTPTTAINALIIGGAEFLSSTYDININQCRPYFVYDNLVLSEASLFAVNIQATGNYCSGDMVLTAHPEVPVNGSETYQWYKNGIAIPGATGITHNIAEDGTATGNYQVMLSQGSVCNVSSFYTVSSVTGAPQVTTVNPTCSTNGSITVTTPADEYSFDGGMSWQASPFMDDFLPGTYSVKMRYASGCTSGANAVNLPVPVYGPAPSCTGTNASCGPTGSITVDTPASEYSFDNGATWVTNNTISNIPTGNYNVKIKDASGCVSYTATVFIDQSYLPDPAYTVVQPYCTANGSITITTPASEYSFDGGTTWQASNTKNNISAGSYGLVIRDAQLCISHIVYVTLNTSTGFPEFNTVPPGCNNSGVITITSPAALYSFDNGATWQAANSKTNLSPGAYTIMYQNANGCNSNPAAVTLFATPWALYPAFTTVPEGCEPGSITITTAADAYSFDGGVTWQATATLGGLAAGSYALAVRNSQGCISFVKHMQLTSEPGTLENPQFTVTNANCSTGLGSINITTTAAQYSFDNGASWATSGASGPLAPGSYQLKIKSSLGCESGTVTATIQQPPVTPLPVAHDMNACQGSTATLSATGTGLLWYTLPSGGIGNVSAPVPDTATAGTTTTYYVSQTVSGCESGRAPLVVTVLPAPTPPVAGTAPVYCQGTATLPLTATGNNLLWYTSLTGGSGSTTAPVPDSTALGTITYYVSQTVNGCESSRVPLSVTILPAPAPPVAGPDVTYCQGDTLLPLTATGTNLLWYTTPTGGSGSTTAPTPAGMGVTVFYVTQTINGCESARIPVTATINPLPAPPTVGPTAFCQGETTSPLTATGSNLLWYTVPTGGSGNTNAPLPNTSIAGTSTYYVSQTVNGCESSRVPLNVTVLPAPAPPVAGPAITYCQGDPMLPLTATGSNLLWYTTLTGGVGSTAAPVPNSIGTNIYYVSQTINGCESNRVPVTGTITPLPQAPQVISPVSYVENSIAAPLTATGTNLTWYSAALNPLPNAPVPDTSQKGTQIYYVSQTINGCESALAEIVVTITTLELVIEYPPYFTPNGDSYHDTWNVKPLKGQRINTFVFDRYGKLLAQFFSPGSGWDGTFNDYEMPSSDYWFLVLYKENGIEKEYRGHFSLLR
ncbi:T9SS type B sorting domain-containing protein [Flavobacterium sp. RHBU_24]|uniref:Ig-like domain-containing protein n=1 Tax=Flavobacterium sp. RHBU_24 TaxID=3391185 RepID=UPI0039856860